MMENVHPVDRSRGGDNGSGLNSDALPLLRGISDSKALI